MRKKDFIQFLEWIRNGIAFCVMWLLILWLIYNSAANIESIPTQKLVQLVFFVAGGVVIFSVLFTRFIIRKWSFLTRLSCFMVFISVYECMAFYYLGFWSGAGTVWMWGGFAGLILVLYFICIFIYNFYSKRRGALYTEALQKYQEQRSREYEE